MIDWIIIIFGLLIGIWLLVDVYYTYKDYIQNYYKKDENKLKGYLKYRYRD